MLIERPELWLSALVGAFVLPPGVWLWLLALAAWQRRRRPRLARLCVGGTMLTLYALSTLAGGAAATLGGNRYTHSRRRLAAGGRHRGAGWRPA